MKFGMLSDMEINNNDRPLGIEFRNYWIHHKKDEKRERKNNKRERKMLRKRAKHDAKNARKENKKGGRGG